MEHLWDNALHAIQHKLDTHQFNHWFKPIVCESVSNEEIVLQVPDRFFQEWLRDNYLDLLQAELREVLTHDINVRFTYADEQDSSLEGDSRGASEVKSAGAFDSVSTIALDQRYCFESFVVGASNQFAHAACIAVTESPGHNYNPLFMYGGVGLGKTHLLQSIGNDIRRANPNAAIQYISSESYVNDLISSIRCDRMDEFRAKYRKNCDVLLVDDIQFIAGKDRTQIEFFHTFNSLYAAHKQIVITSDRFPQEIQGLEERLKSRFQWGLIADIQPPELETRVAILNRKASEEGFELGAEVGMFLAQHVKSNVRELEGVLIRLAAHSRLNNVPIDINLSRVVLKDIVQTTGPRITIQQVQKLVASHFDVSVADIKGSRRHRAIAQPRMIAMFLARKYTGSSFPEIGKRFGNRDHSTVISAVKKIERLSTTDDVVQVTLRNLERALNT